MQKRPRRADFSEGLVHLTKDREQVPAFEVLKEILTQGILKGSGNAGYVKGKRRAVCFSEIPLSAVHDFASEPEVKERARYRYYGIALSKKAVFAAGGRPVIYLPDDEAGWIPEEQKWRHVRFEHSKVDWTHEREWRVPDDLDLRKVPGMYILVWSATEAKEISGLKTEVQNLVRGVLPMEHLTKFF